MLIPLCETCVYTGEESICMDALQTQGALVSSCTAYERIYLEEEE